MSKGLRRAVAIFAAGLLIILSWIAYALWSAPRSDGLETKDGATLSVIPIGLGAVLVVWGLILAGRALRRPRR